jgi:DNA-binding CsgD family transcriptional regulator
MGGTAARVRFFPSASSEEIQETTLNEIVNCLLSDAVLAERVYLRTASQIPSFSPQTQAFISDCLPQNRLTAEKEAELRGLPPRNKEIIRLIAAGKKSKEIANVCGGTPHGIDNLIGKLVLKFGCGTRSGLSPLARHLL